MVRAHLARLCADPGADDHRSLGAAAVERAEASAPALYRQQDRGAGCWMRRPSGSAKRTSRPSRRKG